MILCSLPDHWLIVELRQSAGYPDSIALEYLLSGMARTPALHDALVLKGGGRRCAL